MTVQQQPPGLIGRAIVRREDPALLTGRGSYTDDVTPPGTLHAFVVRSPLAHAASSPST